VIGTAMSLVALPVAVAGQVLARACRRG